MKERQMTIGNVIAARRAELGLSQNELVQLLRKKGIEITNVGYSKWETGRVIPNAQQFLMLCKVLGIRDVMSAFLGEDESIFAGLNGLGRERVWEYAEMLRVDSRFSEQKTVPVVLRTLPMYDIAVSAGTGQFLDGDNYEMVEVDDEVPMDANFGVRIAGDSMEPDFHDGQTVWVHQQHTLMSNEIGIFVYDGSAYIKKLIAEDGQVRLRSLNPEYEDIVVSDMLPLRVLGKVLQ